MLTFCCGLEQITSWVNTHTHTHTTKSHVVVAHKTRKRHCRDLKYSFSSRQTVTKQEQKQCRRQVLENDAWTPMSSN